MTVVEAKASQGSFQRLTDEELVQRIRAGETSLFELVMRRYNQRLYRTARAIVKDDSQAEDVMQEAYLQAFAHLGQFQGQARFSTWLTRIAVHEALARVRRNGRLADFDLVSEEEHLSMGSIQSLPEDPEREAYRRELRELLESSIETLPGGLRAAYVLRDVEGLSTAEAAECLEITEDALKTRLSRARSLLRDELYARAGTAATEVFAFHASRCDRVVAAVMERISSERT